MIYDFGKFAMLAAVALACLAIGASAQDIRSYAKNAAYDDVKFELTNAIINRGLTIDYTGQIGRMLERTGADVGSTKPLYKQAEFFSFCSAKLSRAMMEAELSNVGFCPYVIFMYEAAGKPGLTTVGYRRLPPTGSDASKKALAEIDALLDGIVKDAVK
jgi:hypothetical protein